MTFGSCTRLMSSEAPQHPRRTSLSLLNFLGMNRGRTETTQKNLRSSGSRYRQLRRRTTVHRPDVSSLERKESLKKGIPYE
jgi:hypothetical protein